MTKRDYKRLALAIGVAFSDNATDKDELLEAVVDQLALALSEDDSRFSYQRFADAVADARNGTVLKVYSCS